MTWFTGSIVFLGNDRVWRAYSGEKASVKRGGKKARTQRAMRLKSPDSKMTLLPGTKLGPFEIRSQLGEGGMGEVYRARDPKMNRDVAIKILPADFSSDKERKQVDRLQT
jgi:serine/threonine protein kinase